jgi:micrococcal nuclease
VISKRTRGRARLAVILALALALAVAAWLRDWDTNDRGGHTARVVRVVDGDTVVLSGLGKTRLIGVDTPEVYGGVECYGREASAFTKSVLSGRSVKYRVGPEPRDRYGRALAYVWLQDGRFFNALLAARGYATPLTIPPNDDYAGRFAAAARHARHAERGLWSPSTCSGRNPPG